MEPIVKKLYLLSFESRLELSSSHSRADGKKGSTHIKFDKGGFLKRWGPKTLPGFPSKGGGPLQDSHLEKEARGH